MTVGCVALDPVEGSGRSNVRLPNENLQRIMNGAMATRTDGGTFVIAETMGRKSVWVHVFTY
jgi:hypothetical protein